MWYISLHQFLMFCKLFYAASVKSFMATAENLKGNGSTHSASRRLNPLWCRHQKSSLLNFTTWFLEQLWLAYVSVAVDQSFSRPFGHMTLIWALFGSFFFSAVFPKYRQYNFSHRFNRMVKGVKHLTYLSCQTGLKDWSSYNLHV